jgi:hypothetical protein
MFRENKHHLQPYLLSNIIDLTEKHCKRLDNSWAGVFYNEFFCRLEEEPFSMQARYALGFQHQDQRDSTFVASNIHQMDRLQLLVEALPNLEERTNLDTLYTDGGNGSPQADEVFTEHQVTQVQTAMRVKRLVGELPLYETCLGCKSTIYFCKLIFNFSRLGQDGENSIQCPINSLAVYD